MMTRMAISEPGRYYHDRRSIVLREGLRLDEERAVLWHELVHARRGDADCAGWFRSAQERSVEREAAQRAMPLTVMEHWLSETTDWPEFVWHMKVPEPWVRFRVTVAHPAEKALLERACRWGRAESTA